MTDGLSVHVGFVLADVFTREPYRGGNQLAVIPDARGLSADAMQAIAREFNFAETTFVLPAERSDADWRVRIFSPRAELPFAGHPTLGTAAVLADLGMNAGSQTIVLEEGVGPVVVEVRAEGGLILCRLSLDGDLETGPEPPTAPLLDTVLSLPPGTVVDQAWYAGLGMRFCFVHLTSETAVDACILDRTAWRAALEQAWSPHVYVFAGSRDPGSRLYARMFAPALGIFEDPATGSAAGILAGSLASRLATEDGAFAWHVDQGVVMGRPSSIEIAAAKRGGQVVQISVGGAVSIYAWGSMKRPIEHGTVRG